MLRSNLLRSGLSLLLLVFLAFPAVAATPGLKAGSLLSNSEDQEKLEKRLQRFAPAQIGVKPGQLSPQLLKLVAKLVEAADQIDQVFWLQVYEDGLSWYQAILQDGSAKAQVLAKLLAIHYGPWDRMADNQEFIGTRSKPRGAAFYPTDASMRELDTYLKTNPEDFANLMSPYTVVRRKGDGFVSIPFSEKYRPQLKAAGSALREAAGLARDEALKKFLLSRADALLEDNYYASELDWMDTDKSPLILVLGPYEFYEDLLWGAKASFESIIALPDQAETKRLVSMTDRSQEILDNLPLAPELKSKLVVINHGPVTIADEIYGAGSTRAGAQTLSFSLPNDVRVRMAKGTRQVILRNVAQAKFEQSWLPLSRQVIAEDQLIHLAFESYFSSLIAQQAAYAIEPRSEEGKTANLRQRRQVVEEAKSDVLGLFVQLYLAEKGQLPGLDEKGIGVLTLSNCFRIIRLDPGGAHGMAKAILFNYFAGEGVFVYDPTTRRYRVETAGLKAAVDKLLNKIMEIAISQDYEKAGALIIEYGLLSEDVKSKLSDLDDVPVDIVPIYTIKDILNLQNK